MRALLGSRCFVGMMLLSVLTALGCVAAVGLSVLLATRHGGGVPAETLRGLRYVIVGALLTVAAVYLLALRISDRMLAPLRSVIESASRIGSGQADEQITVETHTEEIATLVDTLNTAFGNYRDAVARLERFNSDASHQLRTPLASMRATGEVALGRSRTPEEYVACIGSLLEGVQHMSTVVEQLLLLSRLGADTLRRAFVPIHLGELVDSVVRVYEPLCEAGEQTLVAAIDPGSMHVSGDETLLHQLVANLVDNAIRYTPAGGTIRVSVHRHRLLQVSLTVEDSGPGIPVEKREQIFERFKRLQGGEGEGLGIGLAIVHEVAAAHGGSVEVDSSDLGGAAFRVALPGTVASQP